MELVDPTIILATDCRFWLRNRGDRQRISALCRFLAKRTGHFSIFFAGQLSKADAEMLARDYQTVAVHSVAEHTKGVASGVGRSLLCKMKRAARCATNLIMSRYRRSIRSPLAVSKEKGLVDYHSDEYARRFRDVCRTLQPKCIIIEYLHLAYLLKAADEVLKQMPLRLIDTLDILHERTEQFHKMDEAHWISITRAEEKALLEQFDVVMAIQDLDAAKFRAMVPRKKVITVGHACDVICHEMPADDETHVVYIATGGPANCRSLGQFLSDVWPAVREKGQGRARLVVAGDVCTQFAERDGREGVVLRGCVEDLSAIYAQADIVINPVVFGGGLKIKNVEALCNCKPLITTSVGAEGLEDGADDAFLVCKSTGEMISALTELIETQEHRRNLSQKACEFATSHFTEERAYGELYNLICSDAPSRSDLMNCPNS